MITIRWCGREDIDITVNPPKPSAITSASNMSTHYNCSSIKYSACGRHGQQQQHQNNCLSTSPASVWLSQHTITITTTISRTHQGPLDCTVTRHEQDSLGNTQQDTPAHPHCAGRAALRLCPLQEELQQQVLTWSCCAHVPVPVDPPAPAHSLESFTAACGGLSYTRRLRSIMLP